MLPVKLLSERLVRDVAGSMVARSLPQVRRASYCTTVLVHSATPPAVQLCSALAAVVCCASELFACVSAAGSCAPSRRVQRR
jgi:hypothetical protein